MPQQWLAHPPATGVPADDRRRFDLVVYGATTNGGALCCDATLVSPLTRTGHPHPCTVEVDGAALGSRSDASTARTPNSPGVARAPRSEAAGTLLRRVSFATWSGSEPSARRQQCAPRRLPAGPGVGGEPSLSRSSSPLSTALGCAWPAAPLPGPSDGPALDRVLDLAADAGPSRLPLQP